MGQAMNKITTRENRMKCLVALLSTVLSCAAVEAAEMEVFHFGAEWCGPCDYSLEQLEKYKATNPSVKVEHVDVSEQENHPAIKRYGISGIPSIVVQTADNHCVLPLMNPGAPLSENIKTCLKNAAGN